MMRKIMLVAVLALLLVVLSALPAQAQSCFSDLARAGQPPGSTFVAPLATTLAGPSTPGSAVPPAAEQVGLANQVRQNAC